jgi:hypothetical protein
VAVISVMIHQLSFEFERKLASFFGAFVHQVASVAALDVFDEIALSRESFSAVSTAVRCLKVHVL